MGNATSLDRFVIVLGGIYATDFLAGTIASDILEAPLSISDQASLFATFLITLVVGYFAARYYLAAMRRLLIPVSRVTISRAVLVFFLCQIIDLSSNFWSMRQSNLAGGDLMAEDGFFGSMQSNVPAVAIVIVWLVLRGRAGLKISARPGDLTPTNT